MNNLGLLPAFEGDYGKKPVALTHNESARCFDRWVDLKSENKSPWLKGIKKISLPLAHGEGRFFAPDKTLQKLKKKNLIALKYFL